MNSFMSWVGGKKALRDAVLARFPPYYERYIEVFGGAGWVLFHKPSDNDFEIFNDFNSNLINLYRCVRNKPNKLKYKLQYVLNSRMVAPYSRSSMAMFTPDSLSEELLSEQPAKPVQSSVAAVAQTRIRRNVLRLYVMRYQFLSMICYLIL